MLDVTGWVQYFGRGSGVRASAETSSARGSSRPLGFPGDEHVSTPGLTTEGGPGGPRQAPPSGGSTGEAGPISERRLPSDSRPPTRGSHPEHPVR